MSEIERVADTVVIIPDVAVHGAENELNEQWDEPYADDEENKDADEKKHERRLAQPRLLSIELMQETAIKRGGKCLSTVYKGISENLEWQCCDGHAWEATPRNVLYYNSWCPKCRGNVGEELVRMTLVEAFPGKTFERTRREEWLGRLELDGYNPELKLAFEYQGIQHFERISHFQREEGQFESQLARDALKRELCKQVGVLLLEIPYTIKINSIRAFVRQMLVDLKFAIADISMTDAEFFDASRAGSYNESRLELAKKIAIEKGGVCLANKYITNEFKMPFKCRSGHDFMASLQDINQDESRGPRFCPTCGGTQKKCDDEIRMRVETIGYRFLGVFSKKTGTKTRRYLTVQCSANHASYDVIMDNLISKNGSLKKGCSKCQHADLGKSKRVNIDQWTEETGISLIGEYTSRNKKCTWKCSRGHVFEARLDSLQSKTNMCSACWLVYYAKERNFEILSDIQNNVKKSSSIKWRCLKCNEFVIEASRVSVSKKDLTCNVCK